MSPNNFKVTALKLKSFIDESSQGADITTDFVSSMHFPGSQKTQSQDTLSIFGN